MRSFHVKLRKSVKMIKFEYKHDLQVFSWWMDKNYEVLVIFKFWPNSYTQTLEENLKIGYIWNFSSFTVKLWKSVKMIKFEYKLDLQVVSWWMVLNWEVLVIFKFWPESDTRTLAEILKIDYFFSFSSFTVKLWKSVKMSKFKCKLDLQVVSWWMVQNWEVLVIFKSWPESHTRTLAEILKID